MPKSRKISKPKSSGMSKSAVTVRMYNPGFGDCILLTFPASDESKRYMLIDCGVHHQYPKGNDRMQLVAKDIAKVTGNHLHVVAITHEHTDHLRGFKYAKDIFDKIKIDNLWLAWTEDDKDPIAHELQYHIKEQVKELKSAVNRLTSMNQPLATSLQSILDFELAASAEEVEYSELDYLRAKSAKKLQQSRDYLQPEDVLTIPDVKGVKVYVLGPPRDIFYIKIVEQESEMYPEFAAINQSQAFSAALKSGLPDVSKEDELIIRRSCPFARNYEISLQDAKVDPSNFYHRYYGFTAGKGQGPEWRRIDADWLAPAQDLALKIGNLTNNTSLVLAIELGESPSEKVLLFAGDAQVGNWLSWQNVQFVTGTQGKISGEDLLRRTVLYKVGHHGSRNATLCQKGLEIMDDSNLVAMIPVDQKWANDKPRHWEHPAEKLLEKLQDKAKGRVLRTDTICPTGEILKKSHSISDNDWNAFLDRLDWDRSPDNLWIQYTIEV